MSGTPTLAGNYTVTLAFTQPGRVDTREFTIVAACATGHTQQPDRSCTAPAAVCTQPLGRGAITSQTPILGPETGTWESSCVLPAGRRHSSGPYYVKHYTLTLDAAATVTIDLTSQDQDTYLFLLRGHGPGGTEITHDDDGGEGWNSKLTDISLTPGDYTISASTYRSERTGRFDVRAEAAAPLAVPLSVSGLDASYDATVGEELQLSFTFEPSAAAPSLQSTTPTGLDPALTSDGGRALVSGTPTLAGNYTVMSVSAATLSTRLGL